MKTFINASISGLGRMFLSFSNLASSFTLASKEMGKVYFISSQMLTIMTDSTIRIP